MSDQHTSPISREALDEFICQPFGCNWVLGQLIAAVLQRAQSRPESADTPATDEAYSLIRDAIGDIVDRHGAQELEISTRLIEEVMDAISDDEGIFPPDPPLVTVTRAGVHTELPFADVGRDWCATAARIATSIGVENSGSGQSRRTSISAGPSFNSLCSMRAGSSHR
jgi:hypothetical protein